MTARSGLRRALKGLGWGLLALVGVIGGGIAWLVGAETGTRFIVDQATPFLPEGIQIRVEAGSLWNGLDLSDVRVALPGIDLEIDRIAWRWALPELNDERFHLTSLQVQGVRFRGEPSTTADETPAGPLEIPLPVQVALDRVEVQAIQIQYGETAAVIDRVLLAAHTEGRRVHIDTLEISAPQGSARLAGEAGIDAPYPIKARLDWSAELPEVGATRGQGELSGDTLKLHIDHQLGAPFPFRVQGLVDLAGPAPSLALEGDWEGLRWPFVGVPQAESESGRFRLSGPLADLGIELDLRASAPEVPVTDLKLRARYQDTDQKRRVAIEELTLTPPKGRLGLKGQVALPEAGPELDLSGDWADLRWPLGEGPAQVETKEGRFAARGPLQALQLELDGPLLAQGAPPVTIAFRGISSPYNLEITRLDLGLLGGHLGVKGQVAPDVPSWNLELTGANLQPGLFLPEVQGRIGLDAAVEGTFWEDTLRVKTTLRRVDGTLMGYPLAAQGEASYNAGRISIPGLEVRSGPNLLKIKGSALPELNLELDLNAPNLATLWPGLAGTAKVAARVGGTTGAPVVDATLTAAGVRFNDLVLAAADGRVRWPGTAKEGTQINLRGISAGGDSWEKAGLRLDGPLDAHQLTLDLQGKPLTLALRAAGGVKGGTWAGSLESLSLQRAEIGAWKSTGPARLEAASAQARLDSLCLQRAKDETLCTRTGWDATKGLDANLELAGLDLAMVKPWLPPGVAVKGLLDAKVEARGQGEGLTAVGAVVPRSGVLTVPGAIINGGSGPMQIAYADTRLDFKYKGGGAEARLALKLPGHGQASADLQLGAPDGKGDQRLGGRVQADMPTLDLIRGFVPQVEIERGALAVDATLAGSLARPVVRGQVQLKDGIANLRDIGIRVEEIQLAVQSDGAAQGNQRLVLKGQARSGQGMLSINGGVGLDAARNWPFEVQVQGKEFQVIRLPEAEARASLDIQVQGDALGARIAGRVDIPQARVEVKTLPEGAAAVSGDEVLVGGSHKQPAAKKGGGFLTGTVNLGLGQDVSFAGFGLATHLEGGLELRITGTGTEGRGAIQLVKGQYKAYGQDLTIEKGRFLFTGPLDNPGIDLRAFRLSKDEKVRAFLQVAGPARKPKLTVFTEPALPEGDALAYLLTGNAAGQSEGMNIAAAAARMGLDVTQPAFNSIKQGSGLDEFGVEQKGSDLNSAALVVGKYLNPDLYVGYTKGLFSPEGAVTVRYRLTDRFSVESKSGTQQSVQLKYSFEHD